MLKAAWSTSVFMCCLAGTLSLAQAGSTNPEAKPPGGSAKVQVLSVGQMAPADAALLSHRRADIAAAAEFHGYDLSSGTWIQSQVACPYAPGYVIVHDVQMGRDGYISLFTALLPRGPGKVRIIPVLDHGAQVLRAFGSTPEQRSLIDDVISARLLSQTSNENVDWVTLAFCYGALGGTEPAGSGEPDAEQTVPRLEMDQNGKLREMSFTVAGQNHFLQDWKIQFDGHGKAKSITFSTRALQPTMEISGQPPHGNAIPSGAQPHGRPLPNSAPPVQNPVPSPQ